MFFKKITKPMTAAMMASAIIFTGTNPATAGMYCEDQYGEAISQVKATYAPELERLQKEIKRIQDAGLDPNKYVVKFEGHHVSITYKYGVLFGRYQSGAAHAAGSAEGCMKTVAPAQLAADLGVILGTGGLSLILPDRMTSIDMGEILNGKPLGGDSAFIPKLRNDLVKGLTGIDLKKDNGIIGNAIKNPFQPWKW